MIKKGVNVSELPDFKSIEDFTLRSHNRGAILANIYESYVGSEVELINSLEEYMYLMPEAEKEAAEGYMLFHLKQRGYIIG